MARVVGKSCLKDFRLWLNVKKEIRFEEMGKREPLVKYKKGPEIATERHLLGMMSCPT